MNTMKLTLLFAACFALAASQATYTCGNGLDVLDGSAGGANGGFVYTLTDFPMPDPECDDVAINCDNPIDGSECNAMPYKGKGGRYLPAGADPTVAANWVAIPPIFYPNGQSALQVRHYTDDANNSLYQALLDADVIEVYVRCDNYGLNLQKGCIRFTVNDDDLPDQATCDVLNNDVDIVCPPADIPAQLDDPVSCTYATKVSSWDTSATTSGYVLDLQFTSANNLTFWTVDLDLPSDDLVNPQPWNIRCFSQADVANTNVGTGYSYPSNANVLENVLVGNMGFTAESLTIGGNDLEGLSLNGVPCTRVPFVENIPPQYVPEDVCQLKFNSQVGSSGFPTYALPPADTVDTAINCLGAAYDEFDAIFQEGCNAVTVDGYNGRYRDSNNDWVYFGNLFYPTQSRLNVRQYLDAGNALRAALAASSEIQVFARCDNNGAPTTSCLSFNVVLVDGTVDVCPEDQVNPVVYGPECEGDVDPINSCTFAYDIRNEWETGFTIDFQFTPDVSIGNWSIEWSVHNGVDVVRSPWNVNCWEQNGNVNTGRNYPSNAAVMGGMMMSNLGYNADRDAANNGTDVPEIVSFALNGVVCTETTYMVGADSAVFIAASSSAAGVGIAAAVAGVALVVAGIAVGRRMSKKPSRSSRSRSASVDSSEVTKGGISSVTHRGSVTSRNGRVA